MSIYSGASFKNAAHNLEKQNIASGFDFLGITAGFLPNQSLIDLSATSTYGQALFAGLLNTLLVAVIGIVLATIIGFVMGVARLSNNWVVSKLATMYIEIIRNIPLLLQLFFWYFAVLARSAKSETIIVPVRCILPEQPRPIHAPASV